VDFPDDENGIVLRRMAENGDNLAIGRAIDFAVAMPTEAQATQFAEAFSSQGYAVQIGFAETVAELPWDVIVVKVMVPTHRSITRFEAELARAAAPLGGRTDGWGCFAQTA
jgi:hypothetical protein